jgi:hypothetical protein
MTRPIFEETQLLRQQRLVWILLIASGIGMMIPILSGMYTQLVEGRPWGDKPMTDTGLLILMVAMIVIYALVVALVLSIKLEIRIDEQGIGFRYFPLKSKWRSIRKEDIERYELHRQRDFFKAGGIGYHRNLLTKTESFSTQWGPYLRLELRSKRKIILGTQNYEGLEHAMHKLFQRTTF